MHAREFIKLPALKIVHPNSPKGSPAFDYSMESYFGEYVWSYPKWNEDGWDEAQIRLGDLLEATPDGEMVKVDSLDDWEKLREANKAADIKGQLAPKIRKMQRAIKGARAPQNSVDPGASATATS